MNKIKEILYNILIESNNQKIIAYHGGSNFDSFEYSQIGSAGNELIYGKGFYFTSDKQMAQDFAVKLRHGYIYTCELTPVSPLILTKKEIMRQIFMFYKDNEDESIFWEDMSRKHDILIVKDSTFGGGMKFSTQYVDYIEYVVYDKNIINIIKKEEW